MTATLRPPGAPPGGPPGGPVARLARGPDDLRAAQALRHLCFVEARGLPPREDGLDRDAHDPLCLQVLVADSRGPAAAVRFRALAPPDLATCYAARHHDLAPLGRAGLPLAEVGRLCVRPGPGAAEALRAAWGALACLADAHGTGLLFGCASLDGADPAPHRDALALLRERHLGPPDLRPRPRGPGAAPLPTASPPDALAALRALPPLLRSYLAMGGWVGDHAVPDPDLDTLQVFTAIETARVPAARARALRALPPIDGGRPGP